MNFNSKLQVVIFILNLISQIKLHNLGKTPMCADVLANEPCRFGWVSGFLPQDQLLFALDFPDHSRTQSIPTKEPLNRTVAMITLPIELKQE